MTESKLDWNTFRTIEKQYLVAREKAGFLWAQVAAGQSAILEFRKILIALDENQKTVLDTWKKASDEAQELAYQMYPYQVEAECKLDEQQRAAADGDGGNVSTDSIIMTWLNDHYLERRGMPGEYWEMVRFFSLQKITYYIFKSLDNIENELEFDAGTLERIQQDKDTNWSFCKKGKATFKV
jgi:hypothetical protein